MTSGKRPVAVCQKLYLCFLTKLCCCQKTNYHVGKNLAYLFKLVQGAIVNLQINQYGCQCQQADKLNLVLPVIDFRARDCFDNVDSD